MGRKVRKPTVRVIKSLPFEVEASKSDSGADARTFEGYASVFNVTDLVGDVIRRGAFTETILAKKRPDGTGYDVPVLWQHDPHDPIGTTLDMREDEHGLFVRGRISRVPRGDHALELMRDGVIKGLSIGFDIPMGGSIWLDKDSTDVGGPDREITKVKLWEYSPVTFAANEAAHVTAVKQAWMRSVSGLLLPSDVRAIDTATIVDYLRTTHESLHSIVANLGEWLAALSDDSEEEDEESSEEQDEESNEEDEKALAEAQAEMRALLISAQKYIKSLGI